MFGTRTLPGFSLAEIYLIYVHNFHIGNRRQYEGNISINNDPLHANEGSTDASRRQIQFGIIHDVLYL